MPLREGSVRKLCPLSRTDPECVFMFQALISQMLSALAYLAAKGLCHRDIKPDNILYQKNQHMYTFQLADFGLVNEQAMAGTFCGTNGYIAPEVSCRGKQTPKLDIWSLFVTFAVVWSMVDEKALLISDSASVIESILNAAAAMRYLEPMARVDPELRASAAEMRQLLTMDFQGVDPADQAMQQAPQTVPAFYPLQLRPAHHPPQPIPASYPLPPPPAHYLRQPVPDLQLRPAHHPPQQDPAGYPLQHRPAHRPPRQNPARYPRQPRPAYPLRRPDLARYPLQPRPAYRQPQPAPAYYPRHPRPHSPTHCCG